MNIIVMVDENWAIGRQEKQLIQIPGNQRNFDRLTMGGTLLMGRKTLQAMPQGQPLYGRSNVVLSENPAYQAKGVTVCATAEDFFNRKEEFPGEIFVCGGERVYKEFLPYCDTVYVTFVEKSYDADRYFENLDKSSEWELLEESDEQTYFDITYYFRKYTRKK